MRRTKLILGFIVILTTLFIGFQVFNQQMIADIIRIPIIPLLLYLYVLKYSDTKSYFFWFLALFAAGEALGGISLLYYVYESEFLDLFNFYVGNALFIFAYACLFMEIYKNVDIKKAIKRFPVHIAILLALDIYSVILVSEIAFKSVHLSSVADFVTEITYNSVIMLVLTIALINYISRDSKKAMNILVGALCIVFSEVIQVAYFYVSERAILGSIYSILLVLAFIFLYLQTSMSYSKSASKYELAEKLEA